MSTLIAEGTTYTPTDEDRLWLMRAVAAEGPPHEIVAETLVNGFMWARSKKRYPSSLATWVRAYAQPVNPMWFETGRMFQRSILKLDNAFDIDCKRKIAKQREVYSARIRFDARTRGAVKRALESTPKLPQATDYAAHYVEKPGKWEACTDPSPGFNRFWTRPAALGWRGYTVVQSIADAGSSGPTGAGGGVVLLLIALAFAFGGKS